MKSFKIRGIVEGFYGKPWSMEDRTDMIEFLGAHGYNLYIYAPKDDPFHRSRWREPYPKETMDDLKKLIDAGTRNGVRISIAVSPGLSLVHSDPEEAGLFVKKCLDFAKNGVRSFGIFFDDIPWELSHEADKERFGSLAEAQGFFINEVFTSLKERIKDPELIVCPTEYNGKGDSEYVREIGKIDPEIKVMWTGPECCPKEIPLEDGVNLEKALGRPPLYWDNYPVNDGHMAPELHIGPYTGRSTALVDHSEGFALNPMNQPEASKIALLAAEEFLRDPENYDSGKAWKNAVKKAAGGVSKEFGHFALCNLQSPLHPGEPEYAKRLAGKFWKLRKAGKFGDATKLLASEGEKIVGNSRKLREALNPRLLGEISPWLDEYESWGKVLLSLAKLFDGAKTVLYTEEPKARDVALIKGDIRKLEKLLKSSIENRTVVCGGELRTLAMHFVVRIKAVADWKAGIAGI